ncbi:MAG: ribonuclease P protein component [Burkholderiales bacterium]|nr:ribonuclease P protein component [Burkholderiales bacterium]
MPAGATFPRAARLLESDDFVRALKTRAQRGRLLWVYRRSAEPPAACVDEPARGVSSLVMRPQLGLMIGKKFARTAVLRNAIKRRLREQFRVRQAELPPVQYVVRLNAPVSTKDVNLVLGEWAEALERDIRRDYQRGVQPVRGGTTVAAGPTASGATRGAA